MKTEVYSWRLSADKKAEPGDLDVVPGAVIVVRFRFGFSFRTLDKPGQIRIEPVSQLFVIRFCP